MSSPHHNQQIKKNPLLLKSLTVDETLYSRLDEITYNCKKLLHLKIGHQKCKVHREGQVWDGTESINDSIQSRISGGNDSSDNESLDGEGDFELDAKLISANLPELQVLHIHSGLTLQRQPVAPPTLDELLRIKELVLSPLSERVSIDRSRDEWNLRILAQSSTSLEILDLRGCYLKILSLGWLKTRQLKALHLFYQVPAASVLNRWIDTLKYLTLSRISTRFKPYRSLGPENPGEELDACLLSLASTNTSQLLQIDLRESDCSLTPLVSLVSNCKLLNYIDTRDCEKIPQDFQVICNSKDEIQSVFKTGVS